MTMSPPLRFLAALGLLGLGTLARGEQQQPDSTPLVELPYWRQSADFRATAFGPSYYYLQAAARWSPNAPADATRYLARVRLPDGRVELRPLYRGQGPGLSSTLTFIVPVEAVRNLRPGQVSISAAVTDATGVQVSGSELTAEISRFPRQPTPVGTRPEYETDSAPLAVRPGSAQPLPRLSEPGNSAPPFRFVRVFPTAADAGTAQPGFFLASSEASMRQVNAAGSGPTYGAADLRIGENQVTLDAPAYRLTPEQAQAYLKALGEAEGLGLTYRLPTRDEWTRAARAGRETRFWWGEDPQSPQVHWQGNPPPASYPVEGRPDEIFVQPAVSYSRLDYQPNPFGLWHTYGNLAEWASDPASGSTFWKLGGSFATESADFQESDLALRVEGADQLASPDEQDPPQWVGVRPALTITPETGAKIVRDRLASNPALNDVSAVYDPDSAVATLSGQVADWSVAAEASRLLAASDSEHPPLWFISHVENRLTPPTFGLGELAHIVGPAGPVEIKFDLGYWLYQIPAEVRWGPDMPVDGSTWWVNAFTPEGTPLFSHKLDPAQVGKSSTLSFRLPQRALRGVGVDQSGGPIELALSLGTGGAARPDDPSIVSNRWNVQWKPETLKLPATAQPTVRPSPR